MPDNDSPSGARIVMSGACECGGGRLIPVISGTCECGGHLIPHPWRASVWICDRSHWWNRKAHAYLVATLTIPRAMDDKSRE